MGGGGRARRAAKPESWWVVVESSTADGVGGTMELGEALRAFAVIVGVGGGEGGGKVASWQLSCGTLVVWAVGG